MTPAERGLQAIATGDEAAVLPLLIAAAATGPRDARLLHVIGLVHRALGDLAPAIAAFDAALAINPASARLVHARARAALEAGLPSVLWFERARAMAPADGDVVLGHAAALLADGDPPAAADLLAAMVAAHPGWLAGHEALLRLRYAAGKLDLRSLDAAIATAPRDPRLHIVKITALQRAGEDDAARAALAAAEASAGTAALLPTRATLLTELRHLDDADAAFAALDPLATPALAVHWLRHLLRRGDAARAAKTAEALPAYARPYRSLAWRLLGDPRADTLDDDRFVQVIDFDADALPDIAAALRPLHLTQHQPLDQSVRGGTQTDGPLLSRIDPVLRTLSSRLLAAVQDYIAALPKSDAHPFVAEAPAQPRFAGSWSVRLADGGFHEPHIHGEGWLSSVYYVALPEAGDAGALTLGAPQPSLGIDLPPRRVIEPKPGRLVLFPSTHWHGTRPFARGERLTLAFDIAPSK